MWGCVAALQGVHVVWTPQQQNYLLSEEELVVDYLYLPDG